MYKLARIKSVQMSSSRRKVNFATAIILVTVCQHVRNGEMFYCVIIVTVTKEEFSARRRGMGGRRRSRLYEHAPSWNFLWIVKGDGNVGVHLLLFLSFPLSLLREERTSDPKIPTRRCGYWTYFFKAN